MFILLTTTRLYNEKTYFNLTTKFLYHLFIVILFAISSASCTKRVYYDEKYFDYERQPIYKNKIITEKYQESKTRKIKPIINRNNLVIAFTRFAGGTESEVASIAEAIKIGFQAKERKKLSGKKRVKYIKRVQLLRNLTRKELDNMGSKVERVLRKKYGVNVICTGTLLSDSQLSIEVLDLKTDRVYTEVFHGSPEEIGIDVAKTFFGTKTKKYEVSKTRKVTKKVQDGYKKVKVEKTRGKYYTVDDNTAENILGVLAVLWVFLK